MNDVFYKYIVSNIRNYLIQLDLLPPCKKSAMKNSYYL